MWLQLLNVATPHVRYLQPTRSPRAHFRSKILIPNGRPQRVHQRWRLFVTVEPTNEEEGGRSCLLFEQRLALGSEIVLMNLEKFRNRLIRLA